MLTPQKPAGEQASGRVKVQIAMHALTLAAAEVGLTSKEGQAILKAVTLLAKEFGKTEQESKPLIPAEIQQIMGKQAGAGGAPQPPKPAAPPMPAAA